MQEIKGKSKVLGVERDGYKNGVRYARNKVNWAYIECWVCRECRREGLQHPIARNIETDIRGGRGSEVHDCVALAQTLTLMPLPLFTRTLITYLSLSQKGKTRFFLPRAR